MSVGSETDTAGNKYTAYGIKVTDESGNMIADVPDVFTDEEKAEECIRLFNAVELSVIHLYEVLDDILAN